MTRAEERAWKAYPYQNGMKGLICENSRKIFIEGYEVAEKDLADAAALSSGPDGFYYGKGYQQGKKDTEKHLGWHSVDESLPPVDEEVIVLSDVIHDKKVEGANMICFGHIVDKRYCVDYDGWNIPGVHHWMKCPKIPNED